MRLTESDVERIRAYFRKQPVKKAFLIGSYARAEADDLSDVDFLIELDPDVHVGLGFIQMRIDLETLLGKAVGLVSTRGLSSHIAPFVERDKVLLYEATDG